MSAQPEETVGSLGHLIKSATPLVGRVGAVLGGLIGLLTALEKISGEIVTTIEGFVLVVALVASAAVVWGRHTTTVNAQSVTRMLYPRRHRLIAAAVLVVTGTLTVLFVVRVGGDFLRAQERDRVVSLARQTRVPQLTRAAERATTVVTPAADTTAVSTPTPTVPETPSALQSTDATALNSAGFQAIATKNYTQALTLFQRALQVDATNAQAQLGLGEAFYFTAQYPPAIPPLRVALQLNPNLFEAHAYLGFVYEQRSDPVRAKAEYEEFLRVAPNNAPLRAEVSNALKRILNPTPIPTR